MKNPQNLTLTNVLRKATILYQVPTKSYKHRLEMHHLTPHDQALKSGHEQGKPENVTTRIRKRLDQRRPGRPPPVDSSPHVPTFTTAPVDKRVSASSDDSSKPERTKTPPWSAPPTTCHVDSSLSTSSHQIDEM